MQWSSWNEPTHAADFARQTLRAAAVLLQCLLQINKLKKTGYFWTPPGSRGGVRLLKHKRVATAEFYLRFPYKGRTRFTDESWKLNIPPKRGSTLISLSGDGHSPQASFIYSRNCQTFYEASVSLLQLWWVSARRVAWLRTKIWRNWFWVTN